MVNYNGMHSIEACVRSLTELSPEPAEIIVIDNASTDGSRELIAARFPGVRIVALQENLGPCVARNRGLEEARTRLVYQVDGDVISTRDCLAQLAQEVIARPSVALAQPRVLFDGDRERIHYDGAYFHYAGVMTLRHFYARADGAAALVQPVDAVISAALLVDRLRVLAIGGYDPVFFILYEDHELSYRVRLQGWQILIVPQALVYHREGTVGVSYRRGPQYPCRRVYLQNRNRWLTLYKCHRWRTLVLSLPGIALFELVWLAFAIQQGCGRSYFKGKWDAVCLLPRLRSVRREIQRARVLRDRELLGSRPLTFTPLIQRGALARLVERFLNASLALWWWLVRRAC